MGRSLEALGSYFSGIKKKIGIVIFKRGYGKKFARL